VKIIILRLTFAAAVLAAALGFGSSAGRAGLYGNAKWCAVVDGGADNSTWQCEYDSVEECTSNVLAGNRGFCALNPYWREAK
jgi:hypothetical protein